MPPAQSEVGDSAHSGAAGRCRTCSFDSPANKEAHLDSIDSLAAYYDERAKRARERHTIFVETESSERMRELARRAWSDAVFAASRAQDLHDHYRDTLDTLSMG